MTLVGDGHEVRAMSVSASWMAGARSHLVRNTGKQRLATYSSHKRRQSVQEPEHSQGTDDAGPAGKLGMAVREAGRGTGSEGR